MENAFRDRVLAAAGIFQAAALVRHAAGGERLDTACLRSSIDSIFRIEARDVPEVYGGLQGARCGLEILAGFAGRQRDAATTEILRYGFSLMHLAHKFRRDRTLVAHLGQSLEVLQSHKGYFDELSDAELGDSILLGGLAGAYTETISRLQPRILVKGNPSVLQQEAVVNQVRSLLLAGIRAAVLWFQVGGGRLQFLLQRKRYAMAASEMLATLDGANR